MPQSTKKIGFFKCCQKSSPLLCRFFGFKSCTTMTFMILLKSGKFFLELYAKMPLSNQIAGFLIFNLSKSIGGVKLIFCMQVHI